jgi:hypothetical protein
MSAGSGLGQDLLALMDQGGRTTVPVVPDLRPAFIELYQGFVRDAMLERIVAFGGDPVFRLLCISLADSADISGLEASSHLWPTTQEIYQGACRGTQ